jgi:hypothetical protein
MYGAKAARMEEAKDFEAALQLHLLALQCAKVRRVTR